MPGRPGSGRRCGHERTPTVPLDRWPSVTRALLPLTADTYRPHFLCLYLYELAGEFSTFYTADKVLVADPAVRGRRLLL